MNIDQATYLAAITDLRGLLAKIGRQDFRAYGYACQLRWPAIARSLRTTLSAWTRSWHSGRPGIMPSSATTRFPSP
jgi:hypothetical protein